MRLSVLWTLALCCVGVAVAEAPAPYPPAVPQQDSYSAYSPPLGSYGMTADSAYKTPGAYYPLAYSAPDNMYGVQSGYEGYIVPVEDMPMMGHAATDFFGGPPGLLRLLGASPLIGLQTLLSKPFLHFLPKFGLHLAGKIGFWLLGFSFIVLIGGGFTIAVCTFTPICTLTFLGLGFSRDNMKETMRTYLAPDKLSAATTFVTEAIDKYRKLQGKSNKEKLNPIKKHDLLGPYVKPNKPEKEQTTEQTTEPSQKTENVSSITPATTKTKHQENINSIKVQDLSKKEEYKPTSMNVTAEVS